MLSCQQQTVEQVMHGTDCCSTLALTGVLELRSLHQQTEMQAHWYVNI